jgi:putative acyl-CoA dehydrogenase
MPPLSARDALTDLPTHRVENQPPPIDGVNLFTADPGLRSALKRAGAGWATPRAEALGRVVGSAETLLLGDLANRHPPELHAFDRYGARIDAVEFHPAYHSLLRLGLEEEVHSLAWTADRPGGHAAHAALEYLLTQAEAGVCCPLTMTYASVPSLRLAPALAEDWLPRVLTAAYDPRPVPIAEKGCATIGMAMTEKQGGSDVRANTTRAERTDLDGEYRLTGHKWFCSAPMSDAFLTLAQAEGGLTCFLAPRFTPDGRRNPILIQRLKSKLGNRSNASAEIDYAQATAFRIGEEGRGIAAIMEMVRHTRLDCAVACAGMMRWGAVNAVHHAAHRRAFGRALIDQPLMRPVLADLVVEAEAATALAFRVAQAFDARDTSSEEAAFARIASAVAKFWITKRLPNHAYEAMECLGGNGFVEESGMPRLYREAPVNAIWEGSGNINALDVLRAAARDAGTLDALLDEIDRARGADPAFDRAVDDLKRSLQTAEDQEPRARRIVEDLALCLQASLLLRGDAPEVAAVFIAGRLNGAMRGCYGALPASLPLAPVIDRARVI